MIYVPRRIVFPFFVVAFTLVFSGILFLWFFNSCIVVSEPSVSVVGDEVELKMVVTNSSFMVVKNIVVKVKTDSGESSFNLKDSNGLSKSFLSPGESVDFSQRFPLSSDTKYFFSLEAPFVRPVLLDFSLDEETTNPVTAEVYLPSKLYLNEQVRYQTKLCNVSGSDLDEVVWVEDSDSLYFKEEFFPRSVSIRKGECKPLYSNLTPIKVGEVEIRFVLRVGAIEKYSSKVVAIEEKS
jgi:hypothetical protein